MIHQKLQDGEVMQIYNLSACLYPQVDSLHTVQLISQLMITESPFYRVRVCIANEV